MLWIARGNDFNDPVWRAGAALVGQFIRITDNTNVRFYNVFPIFNKSSILKNYVYHLRYKFR